MRSPVDPRRIVQCQHCGTPVYLTDKWLYPVHPDADFPGTECRTSRLDPGLRDAYELLSGDEVGSALLARMAVELEIVTKTNQLVLALAQKKRIDMRTAEGDTK